MFKINRLEELLTKLSTSLESAEKKRYTANQAFKMENLQIAEGATLNIQLNNMIFSVDIVHECLEIVREMKCLMPINNQSSLKAALNHYGNIMMTKALEEYDWQREKVAKALGLNIRQVRYWISKNRSKIG